MSAPNTNTAGHGKRRSEGAVALIQRGSGANRQWLSRWNQTWGAYYFIGGHRHDDESFAACIDREIQEETELVPPEDYRITEPCVACVEWNAMSRRASRMTHYVTEVFSLELGPGALPKIEADDHLRWLNVAEITGGRCEAGVISEGRYEAGASVSPTFAKVLKKLDGFPPTS